jgi:hypothetical protein
MVAELFRNGERVEGGFGVGDPAVLEGEEERLEERGGVVKHGSEVGSSRWLKGRELMQFRHYSRRG